MHYIIIVNGNTCTWTLYRSSERHKIYKWPKWQSMFTSIYPSVILVYSVCHTLQCTPIFWHCNVHYCALQFWRSQDGIYQGKEDRCKGSSSWKQQYCLEWAGFLPGEVPAAGESFVSTQLKHTLGKYFLGRMATNFRLVLYCIQTVRLNPQCSTCTVKSSYHYF